MEALAGFESVRIGNALLLCADADAVVAALRAAGTPVGAVLTDPPYGQRDKGDHGASDTRHLHGRNRSVSSRYVIKPRYGAVLGDATPFDFARIAGLAPISIVWGAHRFAHLLPEHSLLVWDKRPNGVRLFQGCGEAAAVIVPPPQRARHAGLRNRPMRIFRLLWSGLGVGTAGKRDVCAGRPRVHPMQKPIALMAWCLKEARVPPGVLVLDPFMGAGSSGIAAIEAGHPFVGVELDRRYFEVAVRRIREAHEAMQATPQEAAA